MNITQFKEETPNELAEALAHSIQQIIKEELAAFKKDIQPSKAPEYLSRLEVSELLRVSTVTVDSWTRKGQLTAFRIGNRIRYNRQQIDDSLIKI